MAAETPTAIVTVADRHMCQVQGMSAPRKEANSAEAPQLTATRPNRATSRMLRPDYDAIRAQAKAGDAETAAAYARQMFDIGDRLIPIPDHHTNPDIAWQYPPELTPRSTPRPWHGRSSASTSTGCSTTTGGPTGTPTSTTSSQG